ncbi:ketoreductase [Dyadobacter luteus]|uniref:Ketoreductase n=1 Tax=Dyadobacter luteus TaxID=2259619 RepID=A0A3D8Y746_9BACT|nr:SDR family NAD(P)-dependent oxidoreductase [Dyadobacter luteus]REA58198.1 ketoreductase [Dyadobacter luteus]
MKNKIILITGATDGIGKETAMSLAKQGHTIIIHGRNLQKAENVRDQIIAESGNSDIDILVADLLLLADIKRAADNFRKKYKHLDVLINNAGAFFNKQRETTQEGFEKTITLNLFAPILLTELLLDLLQKSPSARVINLSSEMHKRGGKPDFNDFQLEQSYKPDRAYGLSKLYLIWVSQQLAKQLTDKGINNITVNTSHPGAVSTNFGQDADKGFFINLVFKIAYRFMDNVQDGAMTSIYLATSPQVEGITGKFFDNRKKMVTPDQKHYSDVNQETVWKYVQSIIEPYLPSTKVLLL